MLCSKNMSYLLCLKEDSHALVEGSVISASERLSVVGEPQHPCLKFRAFFLGLDHCLGTAKVTTRQCVLCGTAAGHPESNQDLGLIWFLTMQS